MPVAASLQLFANCSVCSVVSSAAFRGPHLPLVVVHISASCGTAVQWSQESARAELLELLAVDCLPCPPGYCCSKTK